MKNHISIIGAGLTGLMCAIKLAQRGFKVDVFEKRFHEELCGHHYNINGKAGRSMSMDISSRGIYALKNIGVLENIEKKSIPMHDKIFHLQPNTTACIPYGRNDSEHILTTPRTHLYQTLYDACQSYDSISIRYGYILQNIDTKLRTLNFLVPKEKKEAQCSTDIVIGADGVNSKVRDYVEKETGSSFDKKLFSHSYKELNIPKNKNCPLNINAMHLWPRNQFMLVAQPNIDHSFTCALIMKNDNSKHSFNWMEKNYSTESFFDEFFPNIKPFMPTLKKDYKNNPISHLKTVMGNTWIANDFMLLLGDAAHSMVPFFGQGVNCGFEDCTILSDLLGQYNNHWPTVLQKYNQCRVQDANAISHLSAYNYPELLSEININELIFEKELENTLNRTYPNLFRSYHNLVCFDQVPFSNISKIKPLQKNLLKNLSKKDLDQYSFDRALQNYQKELSQALGT